MTGGGDGLRGLARQVSAFAGVGVAATALHYGTLIALVEAAGVQPLPATLAGYAAGGVLSYRLNRRHTYRSDRPHAEAVWRFAAVAGVGFLMTAALMHGFVGRLGLPYLPAQVLTTGVVLGWSFLAHKLWTFGAPR